MGEEALERAPRAASKALLKFKIRGHVSGQGQVKRQNGACWKQMEQMEQNGIFRALGPLHQQSRVQLRPKHSQGYVGGTA